MTPEGERTLVDRITRHWPLKLLAVALAFGAWLVVTTDNRVIQDFPVYVEADFADDVVPVGNRLKQVTLRLRGSAAQFRRFDPITMRIVVDLTDASPGERSVRIQPNDLRGVPSNLEIVMIEPPALTYDLARRSVAERPVEVRFHGDPAPGFETYGFDVTPAAVRVSGPEGEVEMLEFVGTDPVDLTGRNDSFTVRTSPNPAAENVTVLDVREVTVRVRVDEARVRRTFAGVPVTVVGVDPGRVRVTPASFEVVVTGPPRIVDRLGPEPFRLVVDASEIEAGSSRRGVPVSLEWIGVPPRDQVWLDDPDGGDRAVRLRVAAVEGGR